MIKENKDFFLYILGTIALFVVSLIVFDIVMPGTISSEGCGILGIRCLIKRAMYEEKKYDASPEFTLDALKDYRAVVKTSLGDFEIDLYETNAPATTNNFVFLANDDYYDEVKFHRVVKGFVIQAGDRNTLDSKPENDGQGDSGYMFDDEVNWESLDFSKAKIQQLQGLGFTSAEGVVSKHLECRSIAMANSGPDTNSSQFFIVTGDSDSSAIKGLDGRHTVFGKVVSGWETIKMIEKVEVNDSTSNFPRPIEDVVIYDIEIKQL